MGDPRRRLECAQQGWLDGERRVGVEGFALPVEDGGNQRPVTGGRDDDVDSFRRCPFVTLAKSEAMAWGADYVDHFENPERQAAVRCAP